MNVTLYKLADEYLIAAEKLQEMDMPPEVVEDTLESISGDIQEKATNIAMLVRNWESTVEAMEKAEKEIASRRKAVENRINHIKEYLLFNMQRTGIKRLIAHISHCLSGITRQRWRYSDSHRMSLCVILSHHHQRQTRRPLQSF